MVDLQVTDKKLRPRAIRLIRKAAALDEQTARRALDEANGEVKPALRLSG